MQTKSIKSVLSLRCHSAINQTETDKFCQDLSTWKFNFKLRVTLRYPLVALSAFNAIHHQEDKVNQINTLIVALVSHSHVAKGFCSFEPKALVKSSTAWNSISLQPDYSNRHSWIPTFYENPQCTANLSAVRARWESWHVFAWRGKLVTRIFFRVLTHWFSRPFQCSSYYHNWLDQRNDIVEHTERLLLLWQKLEFFVFLAEHESLSLKSSSRLDTTRLDWHFNNLTV